MYSIIIRKTLHTSSDTNIPRPSIIFTRWLTYPLRTPFGGRAPYRNRSKSKVGVIMSNLPTTGQLFPTNQVSPNTERCYKYQLPTA